MTDKPESEQDKMRAWLRLGGSRQMRRGVAGEVYSVHGDRQVRETAAGGKTMVGYMLDPRLKLTIRQRATGSCYGAYSEMATSGGSSEFLKEFVDGGRSGGGGATEKQLEMIRMVESAHKALEAVRSFTYPVGKSRNEFAIGKHNPIRAQFIADALCVNGWSLDAIAIVSGWWVERRDSKQMLVRVVPDRQRKAVAEALRVALDAIDAEWQIRGWSAPFEFGSVEVR